MTKVFSRASIRFSRLGCCGITEIKDIRGKKPENIALTVADEYFNSGNRFAFLLFSDIGNKRVGTQLAKYIKDNKLGSCITMRAKKNPNSRNTIKMWVWGVNKVALKKMYTTISR